MLDFTDNHNLRQGCNPRCPGCAHRTLSAQQSETQKQNWLQYKLAPWQDVLSPLQTVTGEARWNYREKVRLNVARLDGQWQFGMIRRDELIPIPNCPVHTPSVRAVVRLLSKVLPASDNFPLAYYCQAGTQATLILKTQTLPDLSWLDQTTEQNWAATGLEGLWLHLHAAAGKRLFAKNGWHLLWGKPRSYDDENLLYGPTAFQQLIPSIYQQALDEAEDFFSPSPNDAVVDLYCGNGTSLRRWLSHDTHTAGVELSGEAVECAQHNASGAIILRGKCQHRIPQLDQWLQETKVNQRLLYVNPPRTGIETEVLDWITDSFQPTRIAYLSCSAGTLRRDLDQLCIAGGYQVERITPYDFFPQTYHVETLVLLSSHTQEA